MCTHAGIEKHFTNSTFIHDKKLRKLGSKSIVFNLIIKVKKSLFLTPFHGETGCFPPTVLSYAVRHNATLIISLQHFTGVGERQ